MFLNASVSEGTPVSVMEAISCGIPVIATAVGGNPEIVSEVNGLVVSPDPTPGEIAAAMIGLIDAPEAAAAKRQGSRRVWESRYNARPTTARSPGRSWSCAPPAEGERYGSPSAGRYS